MEIDYWAGRWKEGRIGFHEGRTNAFLERHVDRLGPAPKRVLVPLCGKTEDMAFLAARGHHVTGIEAVEDAVKAFFVERSLVPQVTSLGGSKHIRAYSFGRVTVLVGDVFACTPELVGAVDAFYDRAALVALPVEARPRYVGLLRELLAPGSRGLVVSLEYDRSKVEPPPHPIVESELRRLWALGGDARMTQLDEGPFENDKLRSAGIVATERCFAIEL